MTCGEAPSGVRVRDAMASDVPLLLSFVCRMAEFERVAVTATEDSLREAPFEADPTAEALLAWVNGAPAAYAVHYLGFSSMAGRRVLHLEDAFVLPG